MARTKLTQIYKLLNEQSFYDDEDDLLGDFDAQLKKDMAKAGYGKRDTNKIFKRGDDAKFAKDDDQAPSQGTPTKSSPETLMVKLGGDAKTELKISNQTDSNGNIDLSNVTLEFKDKKYEGLEFKYEDDIEGGDHENEGKDVLFVAEAEDGTIFEVEVNAEANFDMSGGIQDVEWRSLETFPSKEDQQGITEKAKSGKRPDYADVDGDGDEEESMEKAFKDKEKMNEGGFGIGEQDDNYFVPGENEENHPLYDAPDLEKLPPLSEKQKLYKTRRHSEKLPEPGEPASSYLEEMHCTEQEIAEGTCGYGEDGVLGDEPAGPHLFYTEDEKQKIYEAKMVRRFKKLANINERKA